MSSGNRPRDGRYDAGQRFSLEDPDFESFLRALKRHGCNLLVTGEAGSDAFAAMARRLLGTPSERRLRLLALTNATIDDAEDLLPDGVGVEDPDVRLFEYTSPTRATATETASLPTDTPASSDLFVFQDDICDAIESIDGGETKLAPAELRLGVADLCPLISAHETEAVAEFVRTVGTSVLQARGMAHYCLPTADDSAIVADLQPEFDARIELRNVNGNPPMHRWHVPEHGLTTPWTEI